MRRGQDEGETDGKPGGPLARGDVPEASAFPGRGPACARDPEGIGELVPPLQLGAPLDRARPRLDRQLFGDPPLVRGPVQGRDEADDPGRRGGRAGRAEGRPGRFRRRHRLPGGADAPVGAGQRRGVPHRQRPALLDRHARIQRREHRHRRSADRGPADPRPPAAVGPGPHGVRAPPARADRTLGPVRGASADRPGIRPSAPGPRRLAPALAGRPVALPPDRRRGRADGDARPRSEHLVRQPGPRRRRTSAQAGGPQRRPLVAGGDRVRPGTDPAVRLSRALPPGRPAGDLLGDATAPRASPSTTTRTSAAASTRSSRRSSSGSSIATAPPS